MPNGVRAYLTCGDDDARAFAGSCREERRRAAMFLNVQDALVLTGTGTPRTPRPRSPSSIETVVVDARRQPPAGDRRRRPVEVPDFAPGPIVDPTGDRDLLCAAFAWADLRGAQPRSGSPGRSSTRSSR